MSTKNYINTPKNTPIQEQKKTQKRIILQACLREHYGTLQPTPHPSTSTKQGFRHRAIFTLVTTRGISNDPLVSI